jgi:hypothetical protein
VGQKYEDVMNITFAIKALQSAQPSLLVMFRDAHPGSGYFILGPQMFEVGLNPDGEWEETGRMPFGIIDLAEWLSALDWSVTSHGTMTLTGKLQESVGVRN